MVPFIVGASNRLVSLGDDPLEGEDDDDDEGIVETDEGTQGDSEQAVTETEKVLNLTLKKYVESKCMSLSV